MNRELRSFVARTRAIYGTSPPTTVAEVRAWVVDPLVTALGWDRRSGDVEPGVVLAGGDLEVEYLLSVDDTPVAVVLLWPPDRPLDDDGTPKLREAMAETGIDRAVETNGHQLLLYAGPGGDDRLRRELPAIPERALEEFTAAAARRRLPDDPRTRAARRLAVRRSVLASRIARAAADAAGGDERAFEAASRAFVDELIRREAGADGARTEADRGRGDDRARPDEASDARADVDVGVGADEGSDDDYPDTETDANPDAEDDASPDEGSDGEFVVRFFDDRGSIGAIGHGRSDAALVAGTEFLLERGLADARLPVSIDDRPVLVEEGADADGSGTSWRELSNGAALYAGGTDADRAARLRQLAERAGLRAMLTGDWAAD